MKKNSSIYLYVAAAVLVLALIPIFRKVFTSALSHVSQPLSSGISSSANKSRGFFAGIGEISNLRSENHELTAKIKELQIDRSKLEELKHENEVLKNQLGFLDQHTANNLVPARIIGKEPFGALDKIIIDRGSGDGITVGAAVVSNGSLVGKVLEVYATQSKITLISSKDSIVQAMLQNSRTLGLVKGSLEGVKLENIPQDVTVSEHEAVLTSGLGGQIPAGILIGYAKGLASSKSDIYKILDVTVAEDLTKLEFVFVVK